MADDDIRDTVKPARRTVEFYTDPEGGHRFRVKGRNGEIVASSEPYSSMSNARRGFRDMLNAARQNEQEDTSDVGSVPAPKEGE